MNNKRNIKKTISLQAAIAAVILSATFFLILLESFKSYEATSNVMVITKSEVANSQQDRIISNIAILPTNLSFYDRLLKNNPEIEDITEGKDADERKELWNDKIKVKESEEGSFISISYSAADANEAKKINSKIVRNLFDSVSMYYNVKDDVDVRLIDGPVVHSNMKYWYLLLLVSILLGYTIAFLMDKMLKNVEVFVRSKASTIKSKPKSEVFDESILSSNERKSTGGGTAAQVNERIETIHSGVHADTQSQDEELNTRDEELERLNEIIQQDIYPNFPEVPVSEPRKASAPDNLPIADSSFFITEQEAEKSGENLEQENSEIEEDKPESEQDIKREPTPEELKKRLNELLRGGK